MSEQQEANQETQELGSDEQTAMTLMQEICASTGQDVQPVVRERQGSYLHIDLVGGDVRATWGRLGQSLDALQFLCNLILSRRVASDIRLVLDADNYRQRRADLLRQRALDLAAEVKARREEAELEPLPSHERRIIHSALADDPDIRTYSEGDDPDRRVVISPRT